MERKGRLPACNYSLFATSLFALPEQRRRPGGDPEGKRREGPPARPGSGEHMSEEPPKPIEAVFWNGSVTVVGVIVGFSLTYLTSWASRPSPWQLHDLIAIVPLAAGSVLQ